MEIKDYFFKYLWVVTLLLIFGVCYFAAGTLNAYLASKYIINDLQAPSAPAAPAADAAANYQPDLGAIVKRNLFNILIAVPAAGPGGAPVAAAVTALKAKLLGVIYFGRGSSWNRATLKLLDDNKSEVFKEGDEVKEDSGMVVEAIEEKLIRVRYSSGQEEEFSLEEQDNEKKMAGVVPEDMYAPDHAKLPPKQRQAALDEYKKSMGIKEPDPRIRKVSETEYLIEQAVIQESLQNLSTLLQQARVVPNMVGEGDKQVADGFRIFRIQQDSIFSKLGLSNGDIIKSINGSKMDNVERGLELIQQLRFQKNFTLEKCRETQCQTVSYHVE
jgi:general secretion pathway protein C